MFMDQKSFSDGDILRSVDKLGAILVSSGCHNKIKIGWHKQQ